MTKSTFQPKKNDSASDSTNMINSTKRIAGAMPPCRDSASTIGRRAGNTRSGTSALTKLPPQMAPALAELRGKTVKMKLDPFGNPVDGEAAGADGMQQMMAGQFGEQQ